MTNKNFPIKFVVRYSIKETLKRKCYFCLSFISCLLVCLVSLVSKTILNQTPIIFLIVSEINSGEMDILLKPIRTPNKETSENLKYQAYDIYLNYTRLEKIFRENQEIKELQPIPRIMLNGRIGNKMLTNDFILINSEKEKSSELGRNYPFSKMGENECILDKNSLNGQSYEIGDSIPITIDASELLSTIIINSFENSSTLNQTNLSNITIQTNCVIAHILDKNYGKESVDHKRITFFEFDHFLNFISKSIPSDLKAMVPNISLILSKSNLNDYTNIIIVNFDKPRTNFYLVSEYETLVQKTTNVANKMIEIIGPTSKIRVELPLVNSMKSLYLGGVFLGLIINIIIVILIVLSVILIYSLLLISVETSSFDFGIIRLIGTSKSSLVIIILIQCLAFSLPAFFISLYFQIPILNKITEKLTDISSTNAKLSLDYYSIIYAFFMTNISPIIAAILPIKSLLSKNLTTSLNNIQSKTSGVKIEIISLKSSERQSLIYFGILNCLYGLGIYYFLPLSLLTFNLGLLLTIFLWILVGMLLGFIILSLNIQHLMQKIITYICLFWVKSYFNTIVIKNLSAHIIRNRKTSLMYSLSVGFFIMITVGYNTEMTALKFSELSTRGAYYELSCENSPRPNQFEDTIDFIEKNKLVYDFAYVFQPIDKFIKEVNTEIINLGKSSSHFNTFIAVSPNYFDATLDNFLYYNENQRIIINNKELSLSEQLYLKRNDGKVGMSGIYKWEFNLRLDDYFFLLVSDSESSMQFITKSTFIIDNAPGLSMIAHPIVPVTRSVILSIPMYADLIHKSTNYLNNNEFPSSYSLRDLPIDKVVFKIDAIKDPIKFANLTKMIEDDPRYMVNIWDYYTFEENIKKTEVLMNFIFNSVSFIVMVFCFFNLSASMTINILEQTKEISIYRSVGVTKSKLILIYICESLILIFSSCIIGVFVGTILSWTMILQRIIFTNLPLKFYLPIYELTIIFIISILGAFITTFFPARNLLKKHIAEIIKLN